MSLLDKCSSVHTCFFHKSITLCRSSSSSLGPGLVIKKSMSCPIFLPLEGINNEDEMVKFLLNFALFSKRIFLLHYKKSLQNKVIAMLLET